MKKIYSILSVTALMVVLTAVNSVFGQSVGIGSSSFTPDASSMLEVQGTGKGLLIPRMAWANIPASPATSLLIYSTDGDGRGVGYYYYDGSVWQKLFAGSGNYVENQNSAVQSPGKFWIDGNGILNDIYVTGGFINGPGITYGTTGMLRIKSNTTLRMFIDNDNSGTSDQFEITTNGSTSPVFWVTEAGSVNANGSGTFGGFGSFDGNLTLVGNSRVISWGDALSIKSNSGITVDLDNDFNGSGSEFVIQKNGTTSVFKVSEDNNAFFYPYGAATGNTGGVKFYDLTTTNWVGLRAADALGSTYMFTLPTSYGTNGQVLTSNGGGLLSWAAASVPNAWMYDGNTVGTVKSIGTIDTRDFPFITDNTERMRLFNSGQLSIGSTTAGGKLDVHQTSSNDVLRLTDYTNPSNIRLRIAGGTPATPSAYTTTNKPITTIYGQSHDGSTGYINAASISMDLDSTGGTNNMPGRIVFSTCKNTGVFAERMRISHAGKVGIGTTSPFTMLNVTLDDAVSSSIANVLTLDKNCTQTASTGIGTGILFRTEDFTGNIQNSAQIGSILTNVGSGTTASALTFSTRTGGAALAERVRINATGNVGIGTNNPVYKLDIQNTGTNVIINAKTFTSGDVIFYADKAAIGGTNCLALRTGGSLKWYFGTLGTDDLSIRSSVGNDVFFINTSEKVGIGTSSPGNHKLFVQQTCIAGSDYANSSVNSIYAQGGDAQFSFGVTGFRNGSTIRSGGVHGALSTVCWGAMGYYSSASINYGGYFTSQTDSAGHINTGFMPNATLQGIGSASVGNIMGSWSRGELFGQTSMGELYASYNLGNQYTSGVSADIVTNKGERMAAYSVTSNDVKVYSDGKAQLSNGSCKVSFDKQFMQLISMEQKPTITVSALGECEGLYIVSIDKDGFTVKEFHNGQANVEFTWIAIGKRVDAAQVSQLPAAIKDKDFDANMKGVMFNENNTEKSGLPIWWDGSKLRFDKAPIKNTDNGKK